MNLSSFARIDKNLDSIYIPYNIAISILEGELYKDISIIDSFRDDAEYEGSIYIHKIFYYEDSAWWLTGLYNFETKKFDIYSYDQEVIVEDTKAHIGLPGVDPSENKALS